MVNVPFYYIHTHIWNKFRCPPLPEKIILALDLYIYFKKLVAYFKLTKWPLHKSNCQNIKFEEIFCWKEYLTNRHTNSKQFKTCLYILYYIIDINSFKYKKMHVV